MRPSFTIRSTVWLYSGHAGWHFVTVDRKNSKVIKKLFSLPRRGWGSIPVLVTLGSSVWKTSIFPESDGTYLMGLKAEIRKKEQINKGDRAVFTIVIREV